MNIDEPRKGSRRLVWAVLMALLLLAGAVSVQPLIVAARNRTKSANSLGQLQAVFASAPAEPGSSTRVRAWPLFGGSPQRNMVNAIDKDMPSQWSVQEGKQKNIKWVAQLGSVSYGGPVIADGKVFVGTNNEKPRDPAVKGDKGIVMCFRESDGTFLWQAVHDKLASGNDNDWQQQGVASTPAVDGKRIYYVNNRCEVVCLNTDTGKSLWSLDMMKEFNVYPHFLANCSPLVAGDLVFVITGNGVEEKESKNVLPSPQAPSFLAIDKTTGKVRWQDNSPGDKILDGQWTNPAYAEVNGKAQVIFPGGDGWLRGFEADTDKLIWKFDCNPKASVFKVGGRGDRNYILATPVVYENKVYVGVGQNPDHGQGVGHLWCVDITKTGDLSPVNDNFDPKADVNKDSGLVWHFGGPAPKGAGRDTFFGRTLSTCAIHDGLLYVSDLDGFMYCLDAKTGQKYWEEDLKASVWGSPSWIDGKIYLGTDDGDVHIFAHGKDKKVLGKIEMEHPIKSTLVAANGTLYVMTDTQLFAIGKK